MALWRDATAGALGPGQGDYDPYGDLSSLVRQIAPGIGTAAQTALQPQLSRPDDSFAAYMADPLARTDADIQQRAAAGPPSAGQSLADLGNMVLPYLAGAAPGGSLSSGIRAYHASPYDFDAFDVSKIGTGQGAQTYGHGIYAAESPAVSGPKGSYDMEFTAKNLGKTDLNQGEADALRMLRDGGSDLDIIRHFADHGYSFDEAMNTLNSVKDARAKIYDLNINADPQQFLNWDKPLSEQPAIQQKLAAAGIINPRSEFPEVLARANTQTGSQIYESPRLVPGAYRDPQGASTTLNQMGIPGIRYLDQGSRGAGQGTSNYVVFDPKIIDILRKYAVPGLISGGAAAGATSAGGS